MKTSMTRRALVDFFERSLQPQSVEDYCPNGLQIEGCETISRVMTGVTASQALIDEAVAWKADALIVHHGLFWKGDDPCLVGLHRKRIAALLAAHINLIAYHLPLDIHPDFGNNVMLARELGLEVISQHAAGGIPQILWQGTCKPCSPIDFAKHITRVLRREPLLIQAGEHVIKRVAWCTGGADKFIDQAYCLGVDAFISGEISEPTVHKAREMGLHYFSCGHHATERYGVKQLAQILQEKFGLETYFCDQDNPV
jgi:dinuclear metal center YbgI/SA1388 family protein